MHIGHWPYEHTETLRLLKKANGDSLYYIVDEDKISDLDTINRSHKYPVEHIVDINKIINDRLYMDQENHVIMLGETLSYLTPLLLQNFPPEPPAHIASKLNRKSVTDEKVRSYKSTAPVIVSGQTEEMMNSLGSVYNASLGVWILNGKNLKALQGKYYSNHGEKILCDISLDGRTVEIYGNFLQYTDLLEQYGTYNEKLEKWFVPMHLYDKVKQIFE